MIGDLPLLRLLQLASPALPVGAYAYSQGLEWAVAAGWVKDEAGLAVWLDEQLTYGLGCVDLPILARLHAAALIGDEASLQRWSRRLLAHRETRELVADDCDRGRALARLLRDLEIAPTATCWNETELPYATACAVVAAAWDLPLQSTAQAYAWGWLENQVLAGVKLIPLGQVAGQRTLLQLAPRILQVCGDAIARGDDDLGATLPFVALASSRHETQYTRLFRS